MEKASKINLGLSVATLCAVIFILFSGHAGILSTGNGSTSHTGSQFDALGGFSVNGKLVVDQSGVLNASSSNSLNIGGGTAITKVGCANSSTFTNVSLTSLSSTTVTFANAGANVTSTNQVFSGSLDASASALLRIEAVAPSSSGQGFETLYIQNISAATVNISAGNWSVCYLQF